MPARAVTPFVLPASLGGAALAVGGLPGFLLGFLAALLGIDRALGFSGATRIEGEHRFARVRRRRARPLPYLADDAGWAATAQRRRLGMQTIAVESVVGTADRHKAASFGGDFRPPAWSRDRWVALWIATRRGETLPPIAVYRVGDRHFVRDGHHRLSVARAAGVREVDAQVVELLT